MNKKEFFDILRDPSRLNESHRKGLEEIISLYPYFQAARVLHLKLLKKQYSFRYNRFLRITAAYTSDRSVLFEYITEDTLTNPELVQLEMEAIMDIELVDETVIYRLEHPEEQQDNLPEIQLLHDAPVSRQEEPVSFSIEDKHTFFEWLRLSSLQPIDRAKPAGLADEERQRKRELIDNFILKKPKIERIPQMDEDIEEPPDLAVDRMFMTETLARLYEKQQKYEEAIKAYEILSLKIPEKSGFFADQIKRIKKLISES